MRSTNLISLSSVLLTFLTGFPTPTKAVCCLGYWGLCNDNNQGTPCCGYRKCTAFCCWCRGATVIEAPMVTPSGLSSKTFMTYIRADPGKTWYCRNYIQVTISSGRIKTIRTRPGHKRGIAEMDGIDGMVMTGNVSGEDEEGGKETSTDAEGGVWEVMRTTRTGFPERTVWNPAGASTSSPSEVGEEASKITVAPLLFGETGDAIGSEMTLEQPQVTGFPSGFKTKMGRREGTPISSMVRDIEPAPTPTPAPVCSRKPPSEFMEAQNEESDCEVTFNRVSNGAGYVDLEAYLGYFGLPLFEPQDADLDAEADLALAALKGNSSMGNPEGTQALHGAVALLAERDVEPTEAELRKLMKDKQRKWRERITGHFKERDVNGDGVLDKDEVFALI